MYKTLAPGCIGHDPSLAEAASILHRYGAQGIWTELSPAFTEAPERTLSLLAENDLIFGGFGAAVPWSAEGKDDFELLEKQAVLAEKYGVDRCSTGIMPFSDTMDFAESYAFHLRRYRESAKILGAHGVRLAVEFIGVPSIRRGHRYSFLKNMDEMLNFLADVGEPNTGLLLDLFHFQTAGHKTEELHALTDRDIVLVHIMDAPDVPMAEQQDLVRALPGTTGVLRIREFLEALELIGYQGPVLPEPFDPALPKLSFEEAARVTMEAVNKVWLR